MNFIEFINLVDDELKQKYIRLFKHKFVIQYIHKYGGEIIIKCLNCDTKYSTSQHDNIQTWLDKIELITSNVGDCDEIIIQNIIE